LGKISWYHSIRWKLALSYLLVSILPVVFFFITVLNDIESYYIAERHRRLQYTAHVEAGTLTNANYFDNLTQGPLMMAMNQGISARSQAGSYRIIVFDNRFMVVHDTNMLQTRNTIIVPEVVSAITGTGSTVGINREEEVVYAASAIFNENGDRIGAVLLAESAADVFDSLNLIRYTIILYSVIAGLVVCVLVIFASQVLISPLKGILRVVSKMSDGHFTHRVKVKGQDEYSYLGRSFNQMSEKLEQAEKAREEFVSNVSHELKTPLSSIKVLSESILLEETTPIATYREFLQDINSEVDRMTVIVNDLLELVKLDRREHGLHISSVELNSLIEDILKRLSPIAEQKRIILLYEDVRQVILDADEVKLTLAISNIVENGIKYTSSGGTVKVVLDADYQNAVITIQDTGIGIPEEEQSMIFNRFYRVDKMRARGTGGTGLGLAISHTAILLHNGIIQLASVLNEGSTFTIRLPIQRGL